MNNFLTIATQTVAITAPEEIAIVRKEWLDSKRQELSDAEKALATASEMAISPRKLRWIKERVGFLRRVLRAMEKGYIVVPRFDSQKLSLEYEDIPLKVLTAINEASAQKLFDEFRIIQGRPSESRRGPYGRIPARDPIIVGVIRTPSIVLREINEFPWPFDSRETRQAEEHFLVAWWRPEDQRPEDSF